MTWFILFGLLLSVVECSELNQQPVIGVLAVPIGQECITISNTHSLDIEGSCFHSLYVQWLEAAGARVIAIPYDIERSELLHLLKSVNGVLFTGGEVELHNLTSQYMKTAGIIVNHSISSSKVLHPNIIGASSSTTIDIHGSQFNETDQLLPIWGTCMGFQTLCVLGANDPNILTEGAFDAEGISLPLHVTHEAETSHLWTGLAFHVRHTLENDNVTCNLHHDGIFVEDFEANKALSTSYTIISTNFDRRGHEFVSTIEHKTSPIFASQWHPERPQFQFSESAGEPNINHSQVSIEAMQAVANFFVAQTRKNTQYFTNKSELAARLIYNYSPHGPEGDSYQAYVFEPS